MSVPGLEPSILTPHDDRSVAATRSKRHGCIKKTKLISLDLQGEKALGQKVITTPVRG